MEDKPQDMGDVNAGFLYHYVKTRVEIQPSSDPFPCGTIMRYLWRDLISLNIYVFRPVMTNGQMVKVLDGMWQDMKNRRDYHTEEFNIEIAGHGVVGYVGISLVGNEGVIE